MYKKYSLFLFASALLASSGNLSGTPISLSSSIPGASLDQTPEQMAFYIFESRETVQPISAQTFSAGEWESVANGDSVSYTVKFSALDVESYEGLWYEVEADGITVGERSLIRAPTGSIVVVGEVETGMGVRFPVGGLQTEAGVTTGVFTTHTDNSSAHHIQYTDAEAWDHVLASDGPGSLLNADLLDNQHAGAFALGSHLHDSRYVNVTGDSMTGALSATNGTFQDVLSILDDNGTETIRLEGDETGSGTSSVLEMSLSDGTLIFDLDTTLNEIAVKNDSGVKTISIDGDENQGGLISLRDRRGVESISIYGEQESVGSGVIYMRNYDGLTTILLDGEGASAGYVHVADSMGHRTIVIDGEESLGDGGEILMYNTHGVRTAQIDGDSGTEGGFIRLYDGLGNTSITLDGDLDGDGRITTPELAITGGSDLSEQFDIDSATAKVEPGMLVSIDPLNPGKLVLSQKAYDRKVAGIVSGAGGVKPGMMMGQEGTVANGEFPVALSGRVYALVDASKGSVKPGDLLTTSDVPGYAMKASDHQRASGSTIGKAMTSLAAGKDLVLVLVSLQ